MSPSKLGRKGLKDTDFCQPTVNFVRSPGTVVSTAVAVHHFGEFGLRVGLKSFVQDRTDLRFDVRAAEGREKVFDGKEFACKLFHGSGHRYTLLLLMLKFFTTKGKLLISLFRGGTSILKRNFPFYRICIINKVIITHFVYIIKKKHQLLY